MCSHPAVERCGGTPLAAFLCAAGSHSGAKHNICQLRAEEGHVHCRVTVLIFHVDVGAFGHQQLHQVGVPLRHCQLQRRLVAVVTDVDVAASLGKSNKTTLNNLPQGCGNRKLIKCVTQ